MEDLKTQTEQRLIQAIKESNLDNNLIQLNIALIQALTNLLSIIYHYEKKVS
ncbi:MAG: hypothetical protein JETCAE03_35740 [Ignavibacteriaceae bacterium]|nr:MAG: hypothetical protein JETCAE03_35740 [Ignavibacteriaceae bacterium]